MSWRKRICRCLPQEIVGPMAVLYEKVATRGLLGFHRKVASEITSLLPSGRILDVGTGPGHLLVEVARRNPDLALVGVDLSRQMLRIAESVTTLGLPEDGVASAEGIGPASAVQLVRADVRDLPFSDGAFDLVVSTLSLHHWHDPAEGLRECLRVTAPGGRCWIYDLRTDVPAHRHAELVTGKGLTAWVLGWIFKFHGVEPKDYEAQSIVQWLGADTTVRTERHAAYLKLSIRKAVALSQERNTRSSPGPPCGGSGDASAGSWTAQSA